MAAARAGGLPAGVHAGTPVAAEVLRSAASPAAAPGSGSAARPGRMLPHTTPGPGRTPASAHTPLHLRPDRQPVQYSSWENGLCLGHDLLNLL